MNAGFKRLFCGWVKVFYIRYICINGIALSLLVEMMGKAVFLEKRERSALNGGDGVIIVAWPDHRWFRCVL